MTRWTLPASADSLLQSAPCRNAGISWAMTWRRKKKFITDNKDEFDKLGVSVSNVDEAENALVTNTEAFIQAMTLRAEAAAAFKLAAEEAEKALKAQTEIDRKKEGGSKLERQGGFIPVP